MKMLTIRRAVVALAALMLLAADAAVAGPIVFTLGPDPMQEYRGENVGPYPGTLTHSVATNFFCLDQTLGATFEQRYNGTIAAPSGWQEEEAAFLAALALHLNHQADGPISFAIWQIMGTMGDNPPDPAAAPYVEMADYAYSQKMISPELIRRVLVFTPSSPGIQRFITGVSGYGDVSAAVNAVSSAKLAEAPEASTFVLGGSALGLVLIAFQRRK